MNVAIIVSAADPAGMTIKKCLVAKGFTETGEEFEESPVLSLSTPASELRLFTTRKDSIACDGIDQQVGGDVIVFATRHASKAGIPSLTVHAPGNFTDARFGGAERTLCIAAERHMKRCLQSLSANRPEGYDIISEATHHGPAVETPCFFIELGSDEKGWADEAAGAIVAQAIIEGFSEELPGWKCAIAIGGPHHGPAFRAIQLGDDYAVSHHCPGYALHALTPQMLAQMRTRSAHPATIALIDWKGLGRMRRSVMETIEGSGIAFLKLK